MTQERPSLLKFEQRPTWRKKTVTGPWVLHTSFPWNSERPKTEHSKWRGRLSTGETEQPAPNNGFGRSSKRLKRNYSLGDRSPARKRSQSVSLTVFVATFSRCRRYPFGTKSRDAYN